MNKEEFLNIFKNCVSIKTEKMKHSIYFYYDSDIARQKKLNRILNTNLPIDIDFKNINTENLLFEYENLSEYTFEEFWINYELWKKIKYENNSNHILKYEQIQNVIKNWLKDESFFKNRLKYDVKQYTKSNNDITNWKWEII